MIQCSNIQTGTKPLPADVFISVIILGAGAVDGEALARLGPLRAITTVCCSLVPLDTLTADEETIGV